MRSIPLLVLTTALATLSIAGSAEASSVVFVRGDHSDIWIANGDGSGARPVTTDGGYSFPSQADDGTIVAQRGQTFVRMNQAGRQLNAPIHSFLGEHPLAGFTGPYWPRVSPDGTKIAYGYFYKEHYTDSNGDAHESIHANTRFSFADHEGSPYGDRAISDWSYPTWADSTHAIAFQPGVGGSGSGATNVAHDDGSGAFTWFDDPAASFINSGALTRGLDKFAGTEGDPTHPQRLRVYTVPTAPWAPDSDVNPPQYRCQLENPPGSDGFGPPTWSPDGTTLAYEAAGSVYSVTVRALADGCAGVGAPHVLIANARQPWFGPADVAAAGPTPGGPTTPPSGTPPAGAGHDLQIIPSVVRGQRLGRTLARGLRVRVTLNAAGGVAVTAAGPGRQGTVASGKTTLAAPGTTVVTLRFSAAARRRLGTMRRVRLKLTATARDTAGHASSARVVVTIAR